MKNQHVAELESYLDDVIAFRPDFRPLGYRADFPAYLNNSFTFHEGKIWDKTVLLALMNERAEKSTPAALKKQWDSLNKLQPNLVLMALKDLPPYDRKRLVHYGVPFVSTNKQLFLPPLGIDIAEYWAATAKEKPQAQLGIVAQEILLGALYDPKRFANQRANTLAATMNLSKMHLTRALRELEQYECIRIEKQGRENYLSLTGDQAVIWNRIFPVLQNPVKERLFFLPHKEFRYESGFRISGEQALAEKTHLVEPNHQILACHIKEWKELHFKSQLKQISKPEPDCVEIELWRYSPTSEVINWSQDDTYVDTLSLLICLRDEEDERIRQMTDELKMDILWLR